MKISPTVITPSKNKTHTCLADVDIFTDRALDSIVDFVVVTDLDLRITQINNAALRLNGYERHELVGESVNVLMADRPFNQKGVDILRKNGHALNIDKINLNKDGTHTPISMSLSVFKDEQGNDQGIVCVGRDVAERKRAELERETIFEIIQGFTATSNLDALLELIHQSIGKVLYAENCYVALVDPKTELLTMQFFIDKRDPLPPKAKLGVGLTAYVFRTGQSMIMTPEVIHELTQAGEVKIVGTIPSMWLGVPLRTPEGIVGVFAVQHYDDKNAYNEQDLRFLDAVGDQVATAIGRKRVEESLRISEEQHRLLFETNPHPAFVIDLETLAFLAVNEAAICHYGYSREEVLFSLSAADLRPAEDASDLNDRLSRIRMGQNIILEPSRHQKKDGSIIDVEVTMHELAFAGRSAAIVLINDVTERRRLEGESKVISEVIKGVTTTSNLDELLVLVHQSIARMLYAENCYVALYDKTTDLLTIPFCVDKFDAVAPPAKLGTGLTAYVLRKGQPMLMDAEVIQGLTDKGEIVMVGTKPAVWLGVPLRTPEGISGVLVVQHYDDPEAYDQRDVGFLSSVGDQIALAIERKRAEEALALESTLMQALMDNIPDAIYFKDTKSRFLRVSRNVHLKGIKSTEDAVGKTDFDFFAEEHARSYFEDEQLIIRTGQPLINKEDKEVFPDGTICWVLSTKVPIFDAAGRVTGIVGTSRDITERKRAEEALRENEAKFRDLFDNAPVAYHELDTEGRYTRINHTEEMLLGYTNDELKGRHPWEFIVEEVSREATTAKLAGHGQLQAVERTYIRKDGSRISVLNEDRLIHDENGNITGIRSTLQDITARKQAEEQLTIFNDKLQQSNRELQDFAYVASHDLQEPLRKVQAFSDRLAGKYADKLEGDGLDYLERMRSAANRMQLLIQDLLIFSRVSTKAQPFTSVDLTELTHEVLSDLEVKIEETGAAINIEDLPTLDADPMQMRQLIQNLVGNALKFRQTGTQPVITISSQTVNPNGSGLGECCQIVVKDNGIGFDEKYTDKIFAVFQRLHGRAEYEGSGVGLAICRRIVERHKGKMTAHSKPGEGASFAFTIPIKQTDPEVSQ